MRVDTHVQGGSVVPPFYDSLLAKLIVHGTDRADALARLRGRARLLRDRGRGDHGRPCTRRCSPTRVRRRADTASSSLLDAQNLVGVR